MSSGKEFINTTKGNKQQVNLQQLFVDLDPTTLRCDVCNEATILTARPIVKSKTSNKGYCLYIGVYLKSRLYQIFE